MKVEQLMQRTVQTCHANDSLDHAAQLMWDHDCGCIPVVDDRNRPLGMLTDRDVCMAAYTTGGPLWALRVSSAMSRHPHTCRVGDTISDAEALMRSSRVRRLPVVNADDHVVGILSLNDIAREASRGRGNGHRDVWPEDVGGTLGAICTPHQTRALALRA